MMMTSFGERQLCFCIQHGDSFEAKQFPHIHYGQSFSRHFSCLVINGVLMPVFFISEKYLNITEDICLSAETWTDKREFCLYRRGLLAISSLFKFILA